MTQNPLSQLLPTSWKSPERNAILELESFQTFTKELETLEQNKQLRPNFHQIFNALEQTPLDQVKVVLLGQDPYPRPNDAIGMSFAVNPNHALPKSLKNIYKELTDDLNIDNSQKTGDLTAWAKQGVLLLNTTLTTVEGQSNAHSNSPWPMFTNTIISDLNQRATKEKPIIFVLWGRHAQEKEHLLTNKNAIVLKASHPSPFSASISFFGSKPFSKINHILTTTNQTPIDWQL